MRKAFLISYAIASTFAAIASVTPVAASDADDAKWISQCIVDNKAEGQTQAVVATYCSCMNDKMPESETQSVTTWEKTHHTEAEACAAKAGWKE